jgi:threonine dehydratase
MPLPSTIAPELIQEAAEFLRGKIRQTPLEHSPELSRLLAVPVYLKLENLQLTGSFKIRGAWFKLAKLGAPAVLTCSAGNHGKGVAFAARELGIRAIVCVPATIDQAKYKGMIAYGAEVRISPFAGYDETEDWALAQAESEALPFVSPFDDYDIMAANGGTLAQEIAAERPEIENYIVPVGGGGMAAGMSAFVPARKIVCCQLEASPGLQASIHAGRAITRLPAVETIAGGIEGGFGRLPFGVIQLRVHQVALVTESEIYAGMQWMVDRHQYLIEPSSAAPLAACLGEKIQPLNGPVAVVISGRNVALEVVRRVLRGKE